MKEVKETKKLAELSKKQEIDKRKLETQKKMLERRIREGSDTSIKAIDVKNAAERVRRNQKEIDKLM